MTKPPFAALNMPPPAVETERRPDGSLVLRCPTPLPDYPAHLGLLLRKWSDAHPDRQFLGERKPDGSWRQLSWGEARRAVDGLAQALLDRGLGPGRPLMFLSGNSIDQALLTLAAMSIGAPVAPVSPAYSLMSKDYAKVHHVLRLVDPAMIYVEDGRPFEGVLRSLDLAGRTVVVGRNAPEGIDATELVVLAKTPPTPAVDEAFARIDPDAPAKYLFTSGSTGMPKGVINTQRMMCANQAQALTCWPFLGEEPPVLVDWLPWNHTFGANFTFNQVLFLGGTLHIDDGRPAPGLIEKTVRNLREIAPTAYYNVPAGYNALIPFLERDEALCATFFRRLRLIFYAGAALPQDLWERLEGLSVRTLGHRVVMLSALGSTETAPLATAVHWPIERAGNIGIPVAGVEVKLAPNGDKLEVRMRGPNVTPGYLKQPELTAEAFDEEGFYRIGDAARLADPDDPAKGLVFDGRVAEDFKLMTGTWVSAGSVRVKALAACSPLLQDAVVTGHDRAEVGLLAWPNIAACRRKLGDDDDELAIGELLRQPAIIRHIRDALRRYNEENPGSSTRIARVLLMEEPPSVDTNEITDKGYINQRATLARRATLVERLHAAKPDRDVIVV